MLTTDLGRPGAARGWWLIKGRFRSSRILSPNLLFREQHDSNSGNTTHAYIMKVSWSIEGISITSTKKIYQYFSIWISFAQFSFPTSNFVLSSSQQRLETF
jgi:hypothetical protein